MGRWWWPWAGAGVLRQPKAESGLGLGHVMAHVHVCAQCLLPVVQKIRGHAQSSDFCVAIHDGSHGYSHGSVESSLHLDHSWTALGHE